MEELFDVLDKTGRKTGKTVPKGTALEQGEYRLGVNIFLYNAKGEFLVQRRSFHKNILPGQWDVHMGHAVAGEESLQTAVREIREELGVKVEGKSLRLVLRLPWEEQNYMIDVYFAQVDIELADCILQEDEVEAVKYISAEGMMRLVTEQMGHRTHTYTKTVLDEITTFAGG